MWMAFPGPESFALSSLGFLWMFKSVDETDDINIEAIYQDTASTRVPVENVSLMGFSFSFDMDIFTILGMLEQHKIPLKSSERTVEHPLIFAGGPVITANPVPYKDFFDFFIIGDGEDLNLLVARICRENREKNRQEILRILSEIEGIYVPTVRQNSVKKVSSFDELVQNVNSGNCALFVDTINFAFDIDIKKFAQRSISEPKNEPSVRGSQEAFVENLRTNTSLIRKNINNENLIIENITIGKTNKNNCAVCYIKDIANSSLVSEAKYRLNNLDVDYVLSSSELIQLICDDPETTLPEILTTERADKACSSLLQGRVVIIYNGSPYALILPVTLFDFFTSQEDINLNYHFSNLLKVLRAIAFFITLLLPGLYLAITIFHRELLPTELLYSIVASRVNVPFPIVVEILMMELSFELIREAGLRVPSPLGSTVGIVGALVLGEAAVSANIVSPILIIIVAITAISSFAIPDFSLGFHLRISRFAYTILGALCGFLGIGIGIFIHLITLCSLKSFGVPYLSPYMPKSNVRNNGYMLRPVWKREKRSDFLNAKRTTVQDKISMKWRNKD